MIATFIRLVLGYFIAAMLSSSVSLTLTATAWASAWTYVAILGGTIIASVGLALVPFIIAGVLGLLALAVSGVAILVDKVWG